MPKFITETNSVICIDDEYIDTNEIAHISKITQVRYEVPASSVSDEFSFSVMLKGHSNVIHFESSTEVEALVKRKFLIQAWSSDNMEDIASFEEMFENFITEQDTEEESDEEDLN